MTTTLPIPATKFIYELVTKDWKEVPTMIRIRNPNKQFESGGMRVCFDVEELDEDGTTSDNVAKFFKNDIPDVVDLDYFNEAMAQCMSDEFAQNFNKLPPVRRKVSFLMCYVVRLDAKYVPEGKPGSFFSYRTQDHDSCMFVMEFKFKGSFTKYNNNFGEVYEKANPGMSFSQSNRRTEILDTAEAFSHFTIQESGGSFLVCDLQGVEDFFTDPQIHTEDGKGLGMGNMGEEGIQKWAGCHKCNNLCRALQLRTLSQVRNNVPQAAAQQVLLQQQRPPLLPPPQQGGQEGGNQYKKFQTTMQAGQ